MGRIVANPNTDPSSARSGATLVTMALLSLGIHLAVNALGGYGYFRDELYYVACSRHLSAGYVDQPPLSIFVLAVARLVMGDSVFAIRFVPAVLSSLSIAALCVLVRRMGGGRAAMVIASLSFLAAPLLLGAHTYYSMNSFDILFWLLIAHALLTVRERPTLRTWLWLGVVVGIGLLNKTSVLWMAGGVAAAAVLTDLRRELRHPGPYLAAGVALLIFSPFVIWNLRHGLPHLEFLRNATGEKYSTLTRAQFLGDQLLDMNPVTFLVALPGLWWCLLDREGRRHRVIGILFLAVFGVLLANSHTKAEYMGAAYPMLFACGAVVIVRSSRRWRGIAAAVAVLLIATGALMAPFAIPVLPEARYVRYAQALGVAPSTPEHKKLAELPQFFADMHGWEELARDVSTAYQMMPEAERRTTVAFVGNYGEAGALELYSRRYPLPRVICGHNSYWFWGPGADSISTFIRLGGTADDYAKKYAVVTPAGVHAARYAMPYENDLGIYIVRGRVTPIQNDWEKAKHFE